MVGNRCIPYVEGHTHTQPCPGLLSFGFHFIISLHFNKGSSRLANSSFNYEVKMILSLFAEKCCMIFIFNYTKLIYKLSQGFKYCVYFIPSLKFSFMQYYESVNCTLFYFAGRVIREIYFH